MRRMSLAPLALLLGCAAGCGSSDGITLVPVSGTVTLDGKPLEGATISFVPEPNNNPSTPGGDVTGAGGEFSAAYRNRPGLAPGKYKVVIVKPGSDAGGKSIPESIAKDPYMAQIGGLVKNEGPQAYADVAKTPLSQEVGASGETGLAFNMKSTAK